jgi:hypothetical protein
MRIVQSSQFFGKQFVPVNLKEALCIAFLHSCFGPSLWSNGLMTVGAFAPD